MCRDGNGVDKLEFCVGILIESLDGRLQNEVESQDWGRAGWFASAESWRRALLNLNCDDSKLVGARWCDLSLRIRLWSMSGFQGGMTSFPSSSNSSRDPKVGFRIGKLLRAFDMDGSGHLSHQARTSFSLEIFL